MRVRVFFVLAYKLLKDSAGGNNGDVFQDMLDNELKYLMGGISLLKNDQKIATALGGETMANAAALAQVLKNKSKELDMNDRIEQVASDILYHDYAKPGKFGLAPNRIRSSNLYRGANGMQLDFRAAGATGGDIRFNRVGGAAIGPRALVGHANGGADNIIGFRPNFGAGFYAAA